MKIDDFNGVKEHWKNVDPWDTFGADLGVDALNQVRPYVRALEKFLDWVVYASAAGTINKTIVEQRAKELGLWGVNQKYLEQLN